MLAGTEETDVTALTSKISDAEPRYSFFNYTHAADDGTEASSVVFIYTCPPGSKVKERMVYASFRRMVIGAASQAGGFEVAKKVSFGLITFLGRRAWGNFFVVVVTINKLMMRLFFCSLRHPVRRRSRLI